MGKSAGKKDRLQKRVARDLLTRIKTEDTEFFGRVYNLAKNGLGFSCNRELEKGAQLGLELNVPGQKTIVLSGKVVWIRELPSISKSRYHVGFSLTEKLQAYELFVETLLRRDYERRKIRRFQDVLTIHSEDVLDLLDAATMDISAEGLYVRTVRRRGVGQQFEMQLDGKNLMSE